MHKQFNTTSIETCVQILKPYVHSSLQVFITDKSLSRQPHFKLREEIVIEGREIWAVWKVLKSDPVKISEKYHGTSCGMCPCIIVEDSPFGGKSWTLALIAFQRL